jgi:hypothetical protein
LVQEHTASKNDVLFIRSSVPTSDSDLYFVNSYIKPQFCRAAPQ